MPIRTAAVQRPARRPTARSRPTFALLLAAAILACALARPVGARAAVPADFYGFDANDVAYNVGNGPGYRDAALAQWSAMGVHVLRVAFTWSSIERQPGVYSGSYDSIVAAAARHGTYLLPIIIDAPSFRTGGTGSGGRRHPTDPSSITPLMQYLVGRYGPNGTYWATNPTIPKVPIRAWQIWNEPHLGHYWQPEGANPAQYTALLKAGYAGVKSVDPGAEVVAAGISQSSLSDAMPLTQFVDGMYRAGAKGYMDDLAVHPYATQPSQVLDVVRSMRGVADSYGDHIPIWITEFGWATSGPSTAYTTDEAGQATRIRQFVQLVVANQRALNLRGLMLYQWRDNVPAGSGWGNFTGVLRGDGTAKPGLAAYRDAIAGAPPGTTPGGPGGGDGITGSGSSGSSGSSTEGSACRGPSCLPLGMSAAACEASFRRPAGAFVGIGAPDVLVGSSDYRRCTLAAIADAGIGVIRQPFRWSRIETSRGHYDFDRYDELVAGAARFGLAVLPVLVDPPRFRRVHGLAPSATAFAAFARRLADRYGPSGTLWHDRPDVAPAPITAWQVWDTPNLRRAWGASPSVARYVRLLRAVRRALRARDAHATVVTGGLAQTGAGIASRRFEAGLAARRRGAWDVLALAPASASASGVLRFVDLARRTLNAHRLRSAPLWVTALAWADGGRKSRLRVGSRGQASRISLVLRRLSSRRGALRLRGVVYSAWRDSGSRRTGLLTASGRPKRAFATFVNATTALR